MSKPNRKQIERLLAEGADLSATISKINAHHEKELAPLRASVEAKKNEADAAYAEVAALVTEYKAAELAEAKARLAQIEGDLRKEMELGINDDDIFLHIVEYHGAKVEVELSRKEAVVEPQALIAAVPEAERDGQFYQCLKVMIQNARKLLGKKFDEISEVKKYFAVKITWK